MDRMQKSAGKFSMRLREVIRSALIFTVISQGLASLRDWLGKVIQTNSEATEAIAKLKGALLTLAQPIVNTIIPAFAEFVNILANIISFFSIIVSALFGLTGEEAADAANGLYDEMEAIEGVGAAATKAGGALAGFDKINRLTGQKSFGGAGSGSVIIPDFSAIEDLPKKLKEIATDLAIKIEELKFSWDKGKILQNKDAWIIALTAILGAVIGGMFGGLSGAIIGLLLGISIGLISCTFLDKTKNPDAAKEVFIVVLASILGAILGTMFGGLVGGVIGLLLGATISLIALEFIKGDASTWDPQDTVIVVLSAILGAILGSLFGGLVGGVIGFLLGALISFVAIKFSEGDFDKSTAIASLRIAIFAILGAILGTMFGGLVGGVLGMVLGLTIGFASVAFDEELEASVRTAAQSALKIALTTIIGALIGAVFGGGVFGAIIGGIIGLTFGLAITLDSATIKNKTGFGAATRGAGFSSMKTARTATLDSAARLISTTIPRLAQGAVIPPNREFLAVLGDQKQGTNIETPLSTMVQAFKQALSESGYAGGGGQHTIILELDRQQFGRAVYTVNQEQTRRIGVNLAGVMR